MMSEDEYLKRFLKEKANGSNWIKIEFTENKPLEKGVQMNAELKKYFSPSAIKSVVEKL